MTDTSTNDTFTTDTSTDDTGTTAPTPAITPDTTLGDLVTERPHLARRLEAFGLDYCCGGQRTLASASDAAGLAVDEVLAALRAEAGAGGRAEWADLGLAELVDHIEATHHAYLHQELPRLEALATKVAGVHGERHPELAQVLDLTRALRADLDPHLRKEEMVLFPMIRQLAAAEPGAPAPAFHCGSAANPISVMLAEHDRTGELLDELRTASGDYGVPADGCASYRALYDGLAAVEADTHLHVHKENNVLFPAVLAAEAAIGQP